MRLAQILDLFWEDSQHVYAGDFGTHPCATRRKLNPKSGRSVMSSGLQDLRHGLRALASHPGLTIAAALSLGLALDAQTSVYCLIDALFLRPPVGATEAQGLVAISAVNRGGPAEHAIR